MYRYRPSGLEFTLQDIKGNVTPRDLEQRGIVEIRLDDGTFAIIYIPVGKKKIYELGPVAYPHSDNSDGRHKFIENFKNEIKSGLEVIKNKNAVSVQADPVKIAALAKEITSILNMEKIKGLADKAELYTLATEDIVVTVKADNASGFSYRQGKRGEQILLNQFSLSPDINLEDSIKSELEKAEGVLTSTLTVKIISTEKNMYASIDITPGKEKTEHKVTTGFVNMTALGKSYPALLAFKQNIETALAQNAGSIIAVAVEKGWGSRDVADDLIKKFDVNPMSLSAKFSDGTTRAYAVTKNIIDRTEDVYTKIGDGVTLYYGWPIGELPLEIYAHDLYRNANKFVLDPKLNVYKAVDLYTVRGRSFPKILAQENEKIRVNLMRDLDVLVGMLSKTGKGIAKIELISRSGNDIVFSSPKEYFGLSKGDLYKETFQEEFNKLKGVDIVSEINRISMTFQNGIYADILFPSNGEGYRVFNVGYVRRHSNKDANCRYIRLKANRAVAALNENASWVSSNAVTPEQLSDNLFEFLDLSEIERNHISKIIVSDGSGIEYNIFAFDKNKFTEECAKAFSLFKKEKDDIWNTTAITPGTNFMEELNHTVSKHFDADSFSRL
ncbi:MAG: hypothetical protein NT079_01125, partial [Candidatus Omnitrophica bacterium]|nr:hypothetical protein [Candidatus Omnitrophota bacterium]